MSWLVLNSLTAAALALLVLAAGRFLKPAPAVMHVLWLFVLLKLVTPPLFTIPIDVAWLQPPPAAEPGAPAMPAERVLRAADAAPLVATAPVAASAGDPLTGTPRAVPASMPWTWAQLALAAWGTGSLLMLAWLAVGLLRGHRRLRALGPVPPLVAREVASLAAQLGVRVPALRDDPGATSPYVWSFGAVRLVLPARTLQQCTPKGRAAVIAHELAHLRRGDHWLAHAELLLAVVLWWHPLFWLARNRLRLWAELACDAWAVASVPDSTVDYATVLVNAVSRPDFAVPAPAVLAARPAARAAFEKRLTMILTENVPCRASRGWWLPFATLAASLFTVPVAAQRGEVGEQDPVRVEIRVNGKEVDELSAAERKALLKRLLREEERADDAAPKRKAGKPEQVDTPDEPGRPDEADKPARTGKVKRRVDAHVAEPEVRTHVSKPKVITRTLNPLLVEVDDISADTIQDIVKKALGEARTEIMDDDELRALGVTEDVLRLIADADRKGVETSIDGLVKSALRAARKVAVKELRTDADLKKLGLDDDVEKLVQSLLDSDEASVMFRKLTTKAIDDALLDVKRDLRTDPELKKLGIDVDTLLERVRSGEANVKAGKVVRRRPAAETEESEAHEEAEEAPAPKKTRARSLIR